MSVDLPAPFSPTSAWTVPVRTLRSTSRLATTPGKRLVTPVSSTATSDRAAGGADEARVRSSGMAVSCSGTGPASSRTGVKANGARGTLARSHGPRPRRAGSGGRVGDLDLAGDDLLLVLVELGLDVVDLTTGGGVVDAALLEVVDARPC